MVAPPKVKVEAGGITKRREISGQTSYLSQDCARPPRPQSRKEVTRLTVAFHDASEHTLEHIPTNQIVTVTE
jgi:hypothetical protein